MPNHKVLKPGKYQSKTHVPVESLAVVSEMLESKLSSLAIHGKAESDETTVALTSVTTPKPLLKVSRDFLSPGIITRHIVGI